MGEEEQQGGFGNFQPWAEPAEESEMEERPEQRKPNVKKQERGMAGTAQMDIRFRATADQQQPAHESGGEQQQPSKPQIFGVPLQVVKKSVKPTVKQAPSVEQEKETVEVASKVSEELDKVT